MPTKHHDTPLTEIMMTLSATNQAAIKRMRELGLSPAEISNRLAGQAGTDLKVSTHLISLKGNKGA